MKVQQKNNVFKSDEPFTVAFSGGRTSAMMLHHLLEAHDGALPDGSAVCFANTGKEMLETLDFVQQCSEEWGVNINWLERDVEPYTGTNKRKKYTYTTKSVDYQSAARQGEPFEKIIKVRNYLPNPVTRYCTVELKIRAMQQWKKENIPDTELNAIGIRYDEPHRAAKMRRDNKSEIPWLPMFNAKLTKHDVQRFWNEQPFDLMLENHNGSTPLGNCDLCFLKGQKKRQSIVNMYPRLGDWWSAQEVNINGRFRNDTPSYKDMVQIANSQDEFSFDYDDESISCYCGD